MVNASMVEITDYIPSCMTLADATWTASGANAVYTMTAGVDLPAGGLAPGESATKEIILQLNNPLDASCDLNNVAEISNDDGEDTDSDPDSDNNNDPDGEDDTDNVSIDVLTFDLALSKNLANGQSSMVMPGDDVVFTFTLFNQGQIAADNIQVTDYVPSDFALNDADWSGSNPANITLTVANGDLPAGGLLPGESTTVDITLTVLMTAVNGDTYVNEGEISSATDTAGNTQVDVDSDPDSDNLNDPNGEDDFDNVELEIMGECDLALTKTVNRFESNGDGTGGTIVFDLNVINQGGCMAYNVSLVDYILPGFTLNDPTWFMNPFSSFAYKVIPGPIAPGETVTMPISFTVTSFDPSMPLVNYAEITGSEDFNGDPQEDTDSDPDGNPANDGMTVDDEVNNMMGDEDDYDLEAVAIMDLAIDKNLDASNMAPYTYGDDILFNICVTNEGNITATDVTVVDHVPAGFTFDPVANPDWSGMAPDVSHTFSGPIAMGAQVCQQITLTFVSGGTSVDDYTNVAEITEVYDDEGSLVADDWDSTPNNDDGDQSEDDEDAVVFRVFDLALSKTTTETGPFTYGQSVTFNMVVVNQGSVPAYDVELIDYIPCGYSFDTSMGWTYDAATGNATTTIAGPVMPGASAIVPIVLTVQACSDTDAWVNLSEITAANDDFGQPGNDLDSDPDSDPSNDGAVDDNNVDSTNGDEDDHDLEVIDIFDLALTKSIDDRGPYVPGDIVEFKINLFNQGNVAASNFEIVDYLREGFVFTAGGNNMGWTSSGTDLVYTYAGPLAEGATATVSLFLEVILPANATVESWYNEAEISNTNGSVDADSSADNDPNNDNDVQPGDDDDDEINEHGGADDEDDNDVADILVTGEIGDRVWKDLDGDGVQDAGEPGVGGVVVTLTDCAGNELAQQTTGTDGSYNFDLLLPGSYMVNFNIDNLPSGCAFTYPNAGGNDELDSDADLDGDTACIDLEAGDFIDNVDAGLIPLASLGNQVWHDLNGDGIFDNNEPGISNIKVELYDDNGFLVGITYTDASGQYLFQDLYPGDYYVKFYKNDYEYTFDGQGGNGTLDSDVNDSNGVGTTAIVTLSAGEVNIEDFDAGLYVCAKVGETIWLDYNQNDLQDPNENGINGVKVKLYRFSDNAWVYYDYEYSGHKPGTPSDDGYFKFCVAPGRYYLEFDGIPSDLVAVVPNFLVNDNVDSDVTGRFGPNTTDEFTVVSTQEKCDLGAGYYTEATIGDFVWMDDNANGMRESNEQGVADVVVRAYDYNGDIVGSTTTDNNGQYMIDQLSKETFYLEFDLPNNMVATEYGMGSDSTMDSDINGANGSMTTSYFTAWPGVHTSNIDAGVIDQGSAKPTLEIVGVAEDTYNKVDWILSTERNVSHYVVERSTKADNKFVEVAKVLVRDSGEAQNTNQFLDYDVIDLDLFTYRIKAVSFDGDSETSKAIALRSTKTEITSEDVTIFPNPVVDELSIDISITRSVKKLTADLYNANGELVKSSLLIDYDLSQGDKSYKINVNDITGGVYSVKIQLDNKVITKKIIVID